MSVKVGSPEVIMIVESLSKLLTLMLYFITIGRFNDVTCYKEKREKVTGIMDIAGMATYNSNWAG